MRRVGRRGKEYIKWRNNIAYPFLVNRDGEICSVCGKSGQLDVAHLQKRGSHPHLKMNLDNVVLKCRSCHLLEHL